LEQNQTYDFLPKPKVQASQFQLHISYFLQNCKKGKPGEMDLPYLKTISQIFYQLQNSRYIAGIKTRIIKKAGPLLTLPKPSLTYRRT